MIQAVQEPLTNLMNETESFIADCGTRVLAEEQLSREEALCLLQTDRDNMMLLFHFADRIRRRFRGDTARMCGIVNAKSGACSEDCKFCAQSAHFHGTGAPVYPLMDAETIKTAAIQAENDGAVEFGIVISGWGVTREKELKDIGDALEAVGSLGTVSPHASLGIMSEDRLQYLKQRGLTCLNHNLETSENFYSNICTTHSFEDRVSTIQAAKRVGIKICSGGIFGMGESLGDRIDLAFKLRDLDVDVVPMNFLHPIPGTPLAHVEPMKPFEILKTIAVYRFILPKKEIKLAGGRELNLRDLQSMIFFAGADSMLVGNYLTTTGRNSEIDRQMVKDLEMECVQIEEKQSN